MLMGKYQNSIDLKSRMIVPAKYRDELGFRCVLTRGIDKCLYIYPMAEWDRFMSKLSALPTSDANVRAFIRHFYANAVEGEIDKQGRLIIPQELREYANIEKDLVTIGILDKIEIWSKEKWNENSNYDDMDAIAESMEEMGIVI